jgi:very-short-patch-repair endonuclease
MNNHYNPRLREYSVNLRTASVSRAEKYLWKALLSRKQTGYGFKRQRPIDRFIADFFCTDLKLIIEIDGSSHIGKEAYDAYRQKRLEDLGYTIIRFSEGEVINRYDDVYSVIVRTVEVLSGKGSRP